MEKNSIIFFLPCAGGNSTNYIKWQKSMVGRVYCLEYQGHWKRYSETQYVTFEEMIIDMMNQIAAHIKDKYDNIYIFGHSMGGWVAYEVAQRLLKQYGIRIKALFLSACVPSEVLRESNIFTMNTDKQIKNFLRKIRQVPDKVLYSDFFDVYLLPAIKNDFRLVNDYLKRNTTKDLNDVPIYCLYGNADPLINIDSLQMWDHYSKKQCTYLEFGGGHFYLYDSHIAKEICAIINDIVENNNDMA